ncbi:hypothetical protein INR49_003542 [Caranx melampygus]|nr:hypothetical protein INR49_003542 [Caranx melampygus]
MKHTVFFIKLLLVGYTTQSEEQIEAKCNEDVSLRCGGEGRDVVDMDFVSVTWYKLTPKRDGIIRKGKDDPSELSYAANSTARIGANYNLLLHRVTPEDSGTYDCDVSANVGSQNVNFHVSLLVHECAAELSTEKTVLNTTNTTNTTNTSTCTTRVEELPVMWSIIFYVAVGIVKITLCVISIWSRISEEETSVSPGLKGKLFVGAFQNDGSEGGEADQPVQRAQRLQDNV